MYQGTPDSDHEPKYFGRGSSNKVSPHKHSYGYEDSDAGSNLQSALRGINFGPSISEDESQVNGILKQLKAKLLEIENYLASKENEKIGIMEDIQVLTQRTNSLAKSISKKKSLHDQYDKIIRDGENALSKISESTKTLLQVVKKENQSLSKLNLTAQKKHHY